MHCHNMRAYVCVYGPMNVKQFIKRYGQNIQSEQPNGSAAVSVV